MALGFNRLMLAAELVIKSGGVPNIVGEAGIGKSALVEQLAKNDDAKLFTTVVSLMQKGDLSLPVPPLTNDSFVEIGHYGKIADVQFGYSHTLVEILKFADQNPHTPIYWFLDEFNRGSQAVQSELMNLVLQRQINGLQLPAQVKIIIAENPDDSMTGFENTEYGVASSDDAIKDRTVRLIMESDVKDWLKWAQQFNVELNRANIHPQIIRYLKEHPQDLYQRNVEDDIFPTPRAWQRVSDVLYELESLPHEQRQAVQLDVLAGNLGVQTATQLISFFDQIEAGLVAKELLTMPIEMLIKRFKVMSEPQKLATIKATLDLDPSVDDNLLQRMSRLMVMMNPDNQYALMVNLSERETMLKTIYDQASNSKVAHDFYVRLERIALTSW